MKELLRQDRKDLFETEYISMLTQFLYKHYSSRIFKILLPSYLIHQVAFLAYIFFVERERDLIQKLHENPQIGATITHSESIN